jgi:putative tricarboxylic transport membrane protein
MERHMQRIHQIAALLFIAGSASVIWEALNLEYYTKLGPGAGFFPFWLGTALGVLSLIWLVQVSGPSGKPKEDAFLPGEGGTWRIVSILASLVVVSGLMDLIGFQLTMFLFVLFLLMILGRQKLPITLIIGLPGSVGLYHLFVNYLGVPLPVASFAVLANLGL